MEFSGNSSIIIIGSSEMVVLVVSIIVALIHHLIILVIVPVRRPYIQDVIYHSNDFLTAIASSLHILNQVIVKFLLRNYNILKQLCAVVFISREVESELQGLIILHGIQV